MSELAVLENNVVPMERPLDPEILEILEEKEVFEQAVARAKSEKIGDTNLWSIVEQARSVICLAPYEEKCLELFDKMYQEAKRHLAKIREKEAEEKRLLEESKKKREEAEKLQASFQAWSCVKTTSNRAVNADKIYRRVQGMEQLSLRDLMKHLSASFGEETSVNEIAVLETLSLRIKHKLLTITEIETGDTAVLSQYIDRFLWRAMVLDGAVLTVLERQLFKATDNIEYPRIKETNEGEYIWINDMLENYEYFEYLKGNEKEVAAFIMKMQLKNQDFLKYGHLSTMEDAKQCRILAEASTLEEQYKIACLQWEANINWAFLMFQMCSQIDERKGRK